MARGRECAGTVLSPCACLSVSLSLSLRLSPSVSLFSHVCRFPCVVGGWWAGQRHRFNLKALLKDIKNI